MGMGILMKQPKTQVHMEIGAMEFHAISTSGEVCFVLAIHRTGAKSYRHRIVQSWSSSCWRAQERDWTEACALVKYLTRAFSKFTESQKLPGRRVAAAGVLQVGKLASGGGRIAAAVSGTQRNATK